MKVYMICEHDGFNLEKTDLIFHNRIDAQRFGSDHDMKFSIKEIEIIEKYVNPKIEGIEKKLTALNELNNVYVAKRDAACAENRNAEIQLVNIKKEIKKLRDQLEEILEEEKNDNFFG